MDTVCMRVCMHLGALSASVGITGKHTIGTIEDNKHMTTMHRDWRIHWRIQISLWHWDGRSSDGQCSIHWRSSISRWHWDGRSMCYPLKKFNFSVTLVGTDGQCAIRWRSSISRWHWDGRTAGSAHFNAHSWQSDTRILTLLPDSRTLGQPEALIVLGHCIIRTLLKRNTAKDIAATDIAAFNPFGQSCIDDSRTLMTEGHAWHWKPYNVWGHYDIVDNGNRPWYADIGTLVTLNITCDWVTLGQCAIHHFPETTHFLWTRGHWDTRDHRCLRDISDIGTFRPQIK